MTKRARFVLAIALILVQAVSAGAITRAARKVGFWEFHGSYTMPQGTLGGLPGAPFVAESGELLEGDASDVYKDGYSIGMAYGQIFDKHWLVSVGFDYSRNDVKDLIILTDGNFLYSSSTPRDQAYNQYDVTLRVLYAVANPVRHAWTPLVGMSANAGYSVLSTPGFQSNSDFDFGMNIDFGVDFKIWKVTDSRRFVTLSSINSWNFFSTDERVPQLQIGAGIRYFFGP
jgi:hypothetical protein